MLITLKVTEKFRVEAYVEVRHLVKMYSSCDLVLLQSAERSLYSPVLMCRRVEALCLVGGYGVASIKKNNILQTHLTLSLTLSRTDKGKI